MTQGPATPNVLGSPVPQEISQHANDWPVWQGDLTAHRNAAQSPITASNVAKLQVAWTFPIKAAAAFGAMTSPPLILGDTIYLQDNQSNVFALDRTSGKVRWEKDYNVLQIGPGGIAVGYGMVYGSTGQRAEAFALDAASGKEIWRRKLTQNSNESVTGQPNVYDNIVYLSTTPDYTGGSKGVLYAMDAKSGSVLWQFDTTTDNLWGNPRLNSGGGLWYPISFDDAGNLYFGVGNPAPLPGLPGYPNGSSRPGPNLYNSCMVSLDPKTGAVRWYVQAAPHDLVDHDFQLTPVLATVNVNGTPTKLAIGAGKTGTVIAAEADTGKVVWGVPVGKHNSYGDGVPLPATPVTVLPGDLGGVETPMAFADDTLFVPVVNLGAKFSATVWELGSQDYSQATGELIALNAADGSVKWHVDIPSAVIASATLANDVVFTGALDGIFRAYDAKSGKQLWTYQAASGLNAPPAIAGDTVYLPAGGPLIKPAAGISPGATPGGPAGIKPATPPAAQPQVKTMLAAFKLGS